MWSYVVIAIVAVGCFFAAHALARWLQSPGRSGLKFQILRVSEFILILCVLLVLIVTAYTYLLSFGSGLRLSRSVLPSTRPAPDILKRDCEKLVEGQLVFPPIEKMRQGQTYVVSARLARGNDPQITAGLDGRSVVVENQNVSCRVSMRLDSQEANAFLIQNMPPGRTDDQFLVANTFTQWDWHVKPLKSGILHLLLYVAPMLYVDGVGEQWKQISQPPKQITVTPDYLFIVEQNIVQNWAIWGTILTAIVVPLAVWLIRRMGKSKERDPHQED